MFRRLIAVSFVTIWFLLFAIEFCEELGFFEYDEVETDQAIETTLAGFGDAIKSPDASSQLRFIFHPSNPWLFVASLSVALWCRALEKKQTTQNQTLRSTNCIAPSSSESLFPFYLGLLSSDNG